MRGAYVVTIVSLLISAVLAGGYFLVLDKNGNMATATVAATASIPSETMAFNPNNMTGIAIILVIMVLLSVIVVIKRREFLEPTQK